MADTLRKSLDLRAACIRRYFPDVLANAAEFIAYADVVEPELDIVIQNLVGNALNTFVYDIDERGARRWEEMLHITPAVGAALEERRRQILAKINAQLPYTIRNFQKMLNATFGAGVVTVSVDHDNYAEWLSIAPGENIDQDFLTTYARQVTPANLTLNLRTDHAVTTAIRHGGAAITYEYITIGG